MDPTDITQGKNKQNRLVGEGSVRPRPDSFLLRLTMEESDHDSVISIFANQGEQPVFPWNLSPQRYDADDFETQIRLFQVQLMR